MSLYISPVIGTLGFSCKKLEELDRLDPSIGRMEEPIRHWGQAPSRSHGSPSGLLSRSEQMYGDDAPRNYQYRESLMLLTI